MPRPGRAWTRRTAGLDLHRAIAWLLLTVFLAACLPQTGAVAAFGAHHAAGGDAPPTSIAHATGAAHGAHETPPDGHAGHEAAHAAQAVVDAVTLGADERTAEPAAAHDHTRSSHLSEGHCLLCFLHTAPNALALAAVAPSAGAAPMRFHAPARRVRASHPWPRFLARAPPATT